MSKVFMFLIGEKTQCEWELSTSKAVVLGDHPYGNMPLIITLQCLKWKHVWQILTQTYLGILIVKWFFLNFIQICPQNIWCHMGYNQSFRNANWLVYNWSRAMIQPTKIITTERRLWFLSKKSFVSINKCKN